MLRRSHYLLIEKYKLRNDEYKIFLSVSLARITYMHILHINSRKNP